MLQMALHYSKVPVIHSLTSNNIRLMEEIYRQATNSYHNRWVYRHFECHSLNCKHWAIWLGNFPKNFVYGSDFICFRCFLEILDRIQCVSKVCNKFISYKLIIFLKFHFHGHVLGRWCHTLLHLLTEATNMGLVFMLTSVCLLVSIFRILSLQAAHPYACLCRTDESYWVRNMHDSSVTFLCLVTVFFACYAR